MVLFVYITKCHLLKSVPELQSSASRPSKDQLPGLLKIDLLSRSLDAVTIPCLLPRANHTVRYQAIVASHVLQFGPEPSHPYPIYFSSDRRFGSLVSASGQLILSNDASRSYLATLFRPCTGCDSTVFSPHSIVSAGLSKFRSAVF